MDKIKLTVKGISGSPENPDLYVLIMGQQGQLQGFPEVMGFYEAQSIAFYLEGCTPNVPFAHDLFFQLAKQYNVELLEVLIKDYINEAYLVEILCFDGSKYINIESRMSDAIALALRFSAPIFATKEVLLKTSININPESKNILDRYSLEELETKLQDAVKNEDYETAISIRNEIRNRNGKNMKLCPN